MSSNNLTFTKHLGKVGISGIWVSKVTQTNTSKSHYYLGNWSICTDAELLSPQPKSYQINSSNSSQNCKVCIKLLKTKQKHTEITNRKKKLLSLRLDPTPEYAVINFITSDNNCTQYSALKEWFEGNFSEYSFEDIISFMAVQNQIHLQDDLVLPIIQGVIRY